MTVDDRIDILITRFVSGEALPEEAMELEDWINRSPANRSYFDKYFRFFDTVVDVAHDDKNQAWKITSDIIRQQQARQGSGVLNLRLTGIAASFILVVAIGLLINKYNRKVPGAIVYETDAIARKLVLKDNSEIIVSPHSSISISKEYGVRNRKITLNGSATFSVVHNPLLELIVDVNTFHIKDIGTRFSVAASPKSDTTSIFVAEGKIEVYDDFGSSENAGAGEDIEYTRSNRKIVVFPGKRDTVIARPKQIEKTVETKTRGPVKKNLVVAAPDSAGELSYQHSFGIKDTVQGRNDSTARDSTQSQRIVADLVRDRLIIGGQPLRFTLSDTAFILNGKRQSDAIHVRYRHKYGGNNAATSPWSWTHGENNPPKH